MSKQKLVWCNQSLHQYDANKHSDCPQCQAIENAVNNPDPDSINTYFKASRELEVWENGVLLFESDSTAHTADSLSSKNKNTSVTEGVFDDADLEFDQPFAIESAFEIDVSADSLERSHDAAGVNLSGEPTQTHVKQVNKETLSDDSSAIELSATTPPQESQKVPYDSVRTDSRHPEREENASVSLRLEPELPAEMVEAGDHVEFDSHEIRLDPSFDELVKDASQRKLVGWLVVVEGPGEGESFNLYKGTNSVGRALSENVSLFFGKGSDRKISRQGQCHIDFDAKSHEFTLSHGTSRNKTRLNNEPVVGSVSLEAYDKISVGHTTLIFVPLCGPSFSWKD